MSNSNSPQGFKSSNFVAGLGATYGLLHGLMAYNASACYRGDPVILSSGLVAVATVTGNTGAAILGVAESFSWVSIAQQKRVWQNFYPGNDSQGNANVEVWFQGNPQAIFDVQVNGGPAVQADVGSFFNFASGTGNTYSGNSGFSLDYSTKNATKGSLPFVLQSIVQAPVSDPASAYNIVRVGIANLTLY